MLWAYVKSFVSHWIALMSGVLGLILAIAFRIYPGAPPWIFDVMCLAGFQLAGFLAFRDIFKEARPYSQETFEHARRVFDGLSPEAHAFLRRVCVERYVQGAGNMFGLESLGFLSHDLSNGLNFLLPPYNRIVPRLLHERDQSAAEPSRVRWLRFKPFK